MAPEQRPWPELSPAIGQSRMADADDYFWVPSDPPFTARRPEQERLDLTHSLFVPREAWVLSGSMVGWGGSVIDHCDAVIFLSLDPAERMRRLETRELSRRDGRPYDEASWKEFLAWAQSYDDPDFQGRSRAMHEAWLQAIDKPVLRLNSELPVENLLAQVLVW